MGKESEKEGTKKAEKIKSIKHCLQNKKNRIIVCVISIFIFLAIIFFTTLIPENIESGTIVLKSKNVENIATKVWNDGLNSVHSTRDAGYIAVGYTTDRDLNSLMCIDEYEEDAIIVKYNEKGEISWKKYLNAKDNDNYNSVQQTTDDGYIAVGYVVGGGNHLLGKPELYDAIIAKYSALGELIWYKKYGTSSINEEFSQVKQTSDGGYIVVGGKRKGYGEYDALIVKYNKWGQITWTKNIGGVGYDYLNSVQQTTDGGYIVIGSSDDGIDNHAFIIKLDRRGKVKWKNIFVTDESGYYNSVKQTSDGGYITVGFCFSLGEYSSLIVKYSKTGDVLWYEKFTGAGGGDLFSSVEETGDGGYIVVGCTNTIDGDIKVLNEGKTHAIIVKFDETGKVLTKNVFKDPLSSSFGWVERSNYGKYLVIGNSSQIYKKLINGQRGKHDVIIIRYNSNVQASEQLILQKATDYHRVDNIKSDRFE